LDLNNKGNEAFVMKSKLNTTSRLAQLGLFVFALVGFSQLASAATLAADHVIRNEVTVNYDDAGGVAQTAETASVDILINLVAAAPQVTDQTTDTLDPVSTNQTVTITLDVVSRANGEDGYYITNIGDTNNGGAIEGTTTVTESHDAFAPLSLGGTSYYGDGTTNLTAFDQTDQTNGTATGTELIVPADSDGTDAFLNGFAVGDTIVLDPDVEGIVCTVNHIVQPAGGSEANATASIYVDNCSAATGTISPGDQFGERGTMTLTISGTAADLIDLTFDVVSADYPAQATPQSFTVNIVAADIDVYKFVRNTTTAGNNPTCDNSAAFLCLVIENGATDLEYYRAAAGQSGVTADPGDVLEYAILIYNKAAQVTDVEIQDSVPLFTVYQTDSAVIYPSAIANGSGGGTCEADTGSTGTCTVDDGAGASAGSFNAVGFDETTDNQGFIFISGTTINATGGHDGGGTNPKNFNSADAATGGEIDASTNTGAGQNEASVLLFQVKVDPQ